MKKCEIWWNVIHLKKKGVLQQKNSKNEPAGCYAKRSKNLKEKECVMISLGFQDIQ